MRAGLDLSTMLQRGRRLEPEALKFRARTPPVKSLKSSLMQVQNQAATAPKLETGRV